MKLRIVMRAVAMMVAMAGSILNWGATFAQAPPTATEAFNLRIKCKAMAGEKAEAMRMHPLSVADGSTLGMSAANVEALNKSTEEARRNESVYSSSYYDAKNNRCYIEIVSTQKLPRHNIETQHRQLYDGQTDDLLAFAKIENGKKVGMVFDREHRKTTDENLGWDDANSYIDDMMLDKRR